MATLNTACYCGLGPGHTAEYAPKLRTSGINTIIQWALHIGRDTPPHQEFGDFVFNSGYPEDNCPFISNGKFNPKGNPAIQAWPNDLDNLKKNSSVEKILFSIGGQGDPVFDFTTVQYMLDTGRTDVLRRNFSALQEHFPAIDGIDLDCEEFEFSPAEFCPAKYPTRDPNQVGSNTIFQLGKILFDLGFEVTFCPSGESDIWQKSMQLLSNAGYTVSRWNLQCYSGGRYLRKNIGGWLKAIGSVQLPNNGPFIGNSAGAYLVPGLGAQNQNPDYQRQPDDPQCPDGMRATFADMNKQRCEAKYNDLAGGFLWNFGKIDTNTLQCGNSIPSTKDYVNAIIDGLSNKCS